MVTIDFSTFSVDDGHVVDAVSGYAVVLSFHVVKYRRSVDMKPKIKLVCFQAWRLSYKSDHAFPGPILPDSFISYYPNELIPPHVVKASIYKYLEQLEIINPVDE